MIYCTYDDTHFRREVDNCKIHTYSTHTHMYIYTYIHNIYIYIYIRRLFSITGVF
jgi:hypothetical protein